MNATPTSKRSVYASFDPEGFEALTDEELDALPFGVIALDELGRIARYNLTEARFARLDPRQVVGRSFFGEVARCTATPEFQGRFEALKAESLPTVVRFEFVFAFRFGAQKVDIELGSVPVTAERPFRAYVCVNRRKFLPRLKDVEAAIEAPLIGELEPDATAQGVSRDAQGRRRMEVEMPMLTSLFRTLANGEHPGHDRLARAWGETWGAAVVSELEVTSLEHRGMSLLQLPMVRAMELVSGYLHRQRLGRLTVDYEQAGRGAVLLRVERSAFAEGPPMAGCLVLEGLFGTVFSYLASRGLVVREASCRARGEERCTFMAVSATMTAAVERALEGPSRPPHALLDALMAEARRVAR